MPAITYGRSTTRSRWDALTLVLACVIMQYVWRVQEVLPVLALVQFTSLISGAAILLFLLDGSRLRRLSDLRHRLYRPMLFILVLAVLSVPMSVHARVSYEFVTGNFVKTVLLVGILVASVRDRTDVERLVRVWVIGGATYVLASILMAKPGSGRLGGGGGNFDPNDLGLFTVCTLPLCAYLMRRGARRLDVALGLGAGFVLLIAVVQSGSRGGFLALLSAIVYGMVAVSSVRRSKRFLVAVVAGTLLLAAAGDAYWQRMSTILDPEQDYNWSGQAESGRMEIWKRGIQYMVKRPILGVGANAFSIAEGTMAEQAAIRRAMGMGFKWSAAHNSYIQIGAELGVFGLIAFLSMMAMAFREARRLGRTAPASTDRTLGHAFSALIVSYAVGGAFISQAYATFLYFGLGVLIALSRVIDREAADDGTPSVVPSALLAGRAAPAAQTLAVHAGASPHPRARLRRGGLA